jgi:hypothetical protein
MKSSSRIPRNLRRKEDRSNGRTDGQSSKGQLAVIPSTSHTIFGGKTVVNMGEDTEDPIDDDFEEREMPPPQIMQGEKQMRRVPTSPHVQVEIPSKGTALQKTARLSCQSSANRPLSPDRTSRYFSQHKHADQSHSNRNDLLTYVESATNQRGRSMTRKAVRSTVKAIDKHSSEAMQDFAGSPDHLSAHVGSGVEDPHGIANRLLSRNRQRKGQIATTKRVSHSVDLTSEDELQSQGDPNITPAQFLPSKKGKQRKPPQKEQYDVYQIFSQRQVWLQNSDRKQWSLSFEENEKLYVIHGDHSTRLTLPLSSVRKQFWCENSPDVIIHKSIDKELNGDSHICLTLGDIDQSKRLVERLRSVVEKTIPQTR